MALVANINDTTNLIKHRGIRLDTVIDGFGEVVEFKVGSVITTSKQVVYNPANGFYYRYVGTTPHTVVAGETLTSTGWNCVGLLRGYDLSDVRNWSTNLEPVSTDAIAGNTAALQLMVDSLGRGATVRFPEGTRTVFNTLWIKEPNVTVTGGGTLDGTLRVVRGTYATSTDIYMNCTIKDVLFETTRGLTDAIQLGFARMGTITNIVDFRGYTTAVHVLDRADLAGSQAIGQTVNRWIISNCHYGKGGTAGSTVNYFIKVEESAGVVFPIADWIVASNEGHALIDHIQVTSVDGLTVSDNIMFFPGYQTQSQIKRAHIYISTGATWVHIHDNKFFESGGTSLYLSGISRMQVHHNLYAFGAQRVPSPQVVVTGTPLAGQFFTQGNISDELIIFPSGQGIYVAPNSGRLNVRACNIQNPSAGLYYYGTAERPPAVGVEVGTGTIGVMVSDCTVREGTYSFPNISTNRYLRNTTEGISGGTGVQVQSVLAVLSVTAATSTINVAPWDAVEVSVASSFGLTTILNAGPTKFCTITNTGSSNFNIASSANLRLVGGGTLTLTQGSSITLRVATGGTATEVSRAIL